MRQILLLRKIEINNLHEILDIYSTFLYSASFKYKVYCTLSIIKFTIFIVCKYFSIAYK